MTTNNWVHQNSKLHYIRFGKGSRLLIAFHGYGDVGGEVFAQLEEGLGTEYTVYAPDLPWHGKTEWSRDHFNSADMAAFVHYVLELEGKTRFELMGHSFGSRLLLRLLPEFVDQLDQLFLLAPDGLKGVMMYTLLPPSWLRKGLIRLLRNPGWLLQLQELLLKMGLLPKVSYNFARYNLASPERRQRLFYFWMSLDSFRLGVSRTRQLLREKELRVAIYMGRYDKIIPPKIGEAYAAGLPAVQLQLLEKGHQLIGEELNALLSEKKKR